MKIIGHRGARGLAPENTLISIQTALKHGVDEIEFDVRVTKDCVPILHHDRTVTDPASNRLVIDQHSHKELLKHKTDLLDLETAARAINRQVVMNIEVKEGVDTKPVIVIIKKLLNDDWQSRDILLGSKSQKTLLELHEALPDIQKVVIERWSSVRAHFRAKQLNTKRFSMNHHFLWWGLISASARRGWEVYPYTINDPAKVERWSRHGLTGIITDFPDRFEK